jgi:peptidoglycan/xylan/chitin deacetylase (PgdA/CDA1 family)
MNTPACAGAFSQQAPASQAMSLHPHSPILTRLAAACSGLSHRVGQGWLRPVLQALQPQAILRIEGLRADQKMLALTIDDSPSPETTRILDMLRDHDATATFFIHGARIRGSAEKRMLRRIHDEGHEVGNHMPESVPSVQLKPIEFAAEFERNHRILLDNDMKPVRFRPSHGFYNRPMAEFMRTRGAELGYRPEFYLGLNFPWDAFFEIPEWYACHNARAAVPGRIVVFHDNQDRRDRRGRIINQSLRTLAALPVFFSELEKQGFKARSLAHLEGASSFAPKF